MLLDEITDEELRQKLEANGGNVTHLANQLGIARASLRRVLHQRGVRVSPARADYVAAVRRNGNPKRRAGRTSKPRLTRESLAQALAPPNSCRVKEFLDGLDPDDRDIVIEAVNYDRRDLPAPKLHDWLVSSGFARDSVPGADAINSHRTGTRPCRCKG